MSILEVESQKPLTERKSDVDFPASQKRLDCYSGLFLTSEMSVHRRVQDAVAQG